MNQWENKSGSVDCYISVTAWCVHLLRCDELSAGRWFKFSYRRHGRAQAFLDEDSAYTCSYIVCFRPDWLDTLSHRFVFRTEQSKDLASIA